MIYLFRAQEALGYRLRDRRGQRRRQRGSHAHRRGHRRSHGAGRRLARAVPIVVHPRPRAHRRAGQARGRAGGARSLSGRRHHPGGRRGARTWTLPPADASSGCAADPATRFSTRAPIDSAPSARALPAGRPTRSRLPSTSRPTSLPPTIGACRPGRPAIPAYYAALPGLALLAIDRHRHRPRDISRASRAASSTLVDQHGFHTVASRDPARLAGTVAVDVPDARRCRPHAQRPRHRRRLPSRGRNPRGPARLQHDRGGRGGDDGDGRDRADQGLRAGDDYRRDVVSRNHDGAMARWREVM